MTREWEGRPTVAAEFRIHHLQHTYYNMGKGGHGAVFRTPNPALGLGSDCRRSEQRYAGKER